jgi:hypothetical protein
MPKKAPIYTCRKSPANVRKLRPVAPASRHRDEQVNSADALARAMTAPESQLSATNLLALQQTVGNKAVLQLLYSRIEASTSLTKSAPPVVQAKLAVGPVNDHFEQEADRIAKVSTGHSPEGCQPAASIAPLAQRHTKLQKAGALQAKRNGPSGGLLAESEFETRLRASSGSGTRLPDQLRVRMEHLLGADLSGVRIHTDSRSTALNREIGAQAFTHGADIYFRPGAYDPGTEKGRQLIAHELTHVVQQAGGATSPTELRRKVSISPSPLGIVQRQPYPEEDDYQFGMDPEVYYERRRTQYVVPDYDPIDDPDVPQGPGRLSRMGSAIASGAGRLGRGIASGAGWLRDKMAPGVRWLGRNARDAGGWLKSKFLGGHWGGSSADQQVQHVGSRMGLAAGVATAGGGIGSLISTSAVHGADERVLDPTLQQADLALRREGGPQTFSHVGQGFGAASGVASGLGGLVSMGSGLRNIGAEPRLSGRWLRRGIGRTTAGAGQVFAGMAAAGKGISAMTGATTAGAQFMTAAALPASIAMGGVDVLKGGWGTYKAYKSRQTLERKQEELALRKYQVNHPGSQSPSLPKMADFAGFAREYQGKRMGRKVAGMVSGALGVAGGAMMLTGVGLIPGAIVAGLGGLIKVGSGLFGALRDKLAGEECAKAKKQKEQEMAQFAGAMLSDSAHGKDMEEMLTSIGMEEKTIASIKTMSPELRKPFILAQLMRR